MDDFNASQIAVLSARILEHSAGIDADVSLKIAALRVAAETLQQAVTVAAHVPTVRRWI